MTEGSSAAEGTEGGGRMQRLANVRFPRKRVNGGDHEYENHLSADGKA
jgi:hypothetical protein